MKRSFPSLVTNVVADNANAYKGGGSTFGVLLNATLEAYPIPIVTPAFLALNSTDTEASHNGNSNFFSAVAYLHTQISHLSTAGLMGYYSMEPISKTNTTSPLIFNFLIYTLSSTPSALEAALWPLADRLSSTTDVTSSLVIRPTVDFTAFRGVYLSAATVGTNYLAGN